MEESRTIQDVLDGVIKRLSNIKVPMSEIDDIGFPIAVSINEIKACVVAIVENEKNTSDDQNNTESEIIVEDDPDSELIIEETVQ